MFVSDIQELGYIQLPSFRGVRVLMMPIILDDIQGSLPHWLSQWHTVITALRDAGPCPFGVAYLTIDERSVPSGRTHRRPGLHVDGWGEEGIVAGGIWGGGGWGRHGCLMVASLEGCAAWKQPFEGNPHRYGDCTHLATQCNPQNRLLLKAHHIYHLGALTVHESLPLTLRSARQFVRLSLPSHAEWPASCTPNPLGVRPTGPIGPVRPQAFTEYDPAV